MNADRVIKSGVEYFNAGTWAGGTRRQRTILKRGDSVEAARVAVQCSGIPRKADCSNPLTHNSCAAACPVVE